MLVGATTSILGVNGSMLTSASSVSLVTVFSCVALVIRVDVSVMLFGDKSAGDRVVGVDVLVV